MNKLLILFVLFAATSFGQNKKLPLFLGSDFQSTSAKKNIPYMETDPACQIIPSLSLKNDTSGIVYQNEYVLFRNLEILSETSMKCAESFIKISFVSNKEYQEFQQWIRDSTGRESIYKGLESEAYAVKWLSINPKEIKKIDLNKREQNRKAYPLNQEKKLDYTDLNLMPLLAELYTPMSQRFYKIRDFDERKNVYTYKLSQKYSESFREINFQVATISHEAFWAKESLSINDEYSVLGQMYDQLLPSNPVIGITGMQANAFCHWKEMKLQQKITEQGLPYLVRVTLPIIAESVNTPKTLTIPAKDYSLNWRITVNDYQLFMNAIRDSLFMEALFIELEEDRLAGEFLQTKKLYFDEGALEIVELEISDRESNRKIFSLTKNKKILQKYKAKFEDIEARYSDSLYYYRYFRMNVKSKTILGNMITEPGYTYYMNEKAKGDFIEFYATFEKDRYGYPLGMDLNLDRVNQLYQGTGVRGHKNYERFIIQETVSIKPTIPIENQKAEELIKGITYAQALAYFHWKYPISKAKFGDDWQKYVYPNEKQFAQVQNGERIILPEYQLNFPSPIFRYVVHLIPNKEY